jgi:hypothetical protein
MNAASDAHILQSMVHLSWEFSENMPFFVLNKSECTSGDGKSAMFLNFGEHFQKKIDAPEKVPHVVVCCVAGAVHPLDRTFLLGAFSFHRHSRQEFGLV